MCSGLTARYFDKGMHRAGLKKPCNCSACAMMINSSQNMIWGDKPRLA